MRLAVIAALVVVMAGCAESSAEVNAPSAWETKAVDAAFARRAEAALKTAPTGDSGWRVGVVMAEDSKDAAVSALTLDGMVYIRPKWKDIGSGCDGDWDSGEFKLLLDVGDLFTWAGDSRTAHRVCVEDLRVLRKGAA